MKPVGMVNLNCEFKVGNRPPGDCVGGSRLEPCERPLSAIADATAGTPVAYLSGYLPSDCLPSRPLLHPAKKGGKLLLYIIRQAKEFQITNSI